MGTWKNSTNFASAENVRSSNVVDFECELRHIPTCHSNNKTTNRWCVCLRRLCLQLFPPHTDWSWPWPLTSEKSNQFVFVPKCTKVANLVKFPQSLNEMLRSHTDGRTDSHSCAQLDNIIPPLPTGKKKNPHRQPGPLHGSLSIYCLLSRRGLLDPINLAYNPRCRKAGS